ncbi:transferrin-binding protein-like solute binding protein [Salmonella enterica subsp. arizonae serovar 13,23:gz51:-]|uniref:Transferrin-binding protein B C-lobe/N-lobe beta-barrel domain-containing protein n=1 Tax=Salmonella enterica TaxID=28901 RepID=A0A3J4L9B0_SALER|nr:hypothetical protein [Salmonella enterica]EAR4273114.1 hypothetical protein [Salmonella enterica subsp. arizonae serovar 13,23:gz51:-]EBF3613098.1 transferrin-binding protein-like solute binding protein [Salmonella enterica subsp. arizonae serovar [1],13,23:g,z51:-]EBR4052036.1 transferrin-binding protein-like solute binding protein [Salmonella enterica subsp. enterica]ECL5965227.1 transferrin-binding protein-like solute binding protein [Salmonella enterica subsp. enterica serovar [1],13,23:
MKTTFIITSIILSCSLLTACGGGGGNSSKTHSTTTNETTEVVSITTSVTPGSSGNNSGGVTETVSSTGNNSASNTDIPVTTEATEATEATETTLPNKPIILAPVNETRISEVKYNTGTMLTRTVNDTDSTMLHKSNTVQEPDAYDLRMTDGEVIVDIKPLNTGDPADYRELASKNLSILRDKSGEPVGFYGIVETYTSETTRNLSGKEKYGRVDYIVAMNGEEKKLPSLAADYTGKVYYDQEQASGKEADISLRYEDRQVTGTIIDKTRPHFNLTIDTRKPHDVDEDGSFMAELVGTNDRADHKMHGYIDGGFYGKDGEIVAGSIRSRDDDSWGGVFGGEKQE